MSTNLPFFNSNRATVAGLIASALTTTIRYLLGNPFGIDNMYIALLTPPP
jgi:SSS family solute:Na+ symporter